MPSAVEGLIGLHRLEVGEGHRPGRLPSANPFAWVHEPRTTNRFAVCLHTAGLTTTPSRAASLLGCLPAEHFDVMRTPGLPRDELSRVGPLEISRGEPGGNTSVRRVDADRETIAGIWNDNQWDDLAQLWLGDRRDSDFLVQIQAARALHSVLFVTDDDRLLTLPNPQFASPVNIVSSRIALPMLSAWVRAKGHLQVEAISINAGYFYRALAVSMTPQFAQGWPALVDLEHRVPNGFDLMTLGQSISSRLESLMRTLDRMYVVWQLPTNNDTIDELADDFDACILSVAAIQDNLALLATEALGIRGLQKYQIELLNKSWRKKLVAVMDARARALDDYINANEARLCLCAELRHQAIHRAKLTPIRAIKPGKVDQSRLHIYEPVVGEIERCLSQMGQTIDDWGLSNRSGPHPITVSQRRETGDLSYVRQSPGEAFLDPMVFALRLVAQTVQVVDGIFGILDFSSDPRLSDEGRAWTLRQYGEFPQRPEDGPVLKMLSPLAGL